jgi:hypothetical protein
MEKLRRASRRRDFKTVPMILQHPDFWDDEALREIATYRGTRKQVWNNTNLAGPWLNLMRNSINAQIFSFGHKDFLAVSATHGTAHLALFEQTMWDKYDLATLAGASSRPTRWRCRSRSQLLSRKVRIPAACSGPTATPSRRFRRAA